MTPTDHPQRQDGDAHTATTTTPTTMPAQPMTPARASASRSLMLTVATNVAAWAVVLACYWWFASGGGHNEWLSGSIPFHDLIAQGFLAGQLHLTIQPAPELLSMPHPYDPAIYMRSRLPDAALYNGKYYLYFGPVPALMHAAIFTVSGAFPKENVMQLIFALGVCLWSWLLVRELADRLGLGTQHPIVVTAFLICALGGAGLTCATMVLGHFETALANAFFVTGGSWLWFRALRDERRLPTMMAAGLFFGLAVACRAPAIAYGMGAAAALLLYDFLKYRWHPRTLLRVLALGVPYGAVGLGLLYYNYARFGSPFEFGIRYMLTGLDPALMRFAADQIPTSVLAMVGAPPRFLPYFPYQIDQPWQVIGSHIERPMISILLLYPMIWLLPFGVAVAWRAPRDLRTFIVGSGLGVLGAFTVIGTSPWVTARYTQDFGPMATILGVLGLFAIVRQQRGRRYGRPLALGISAVFTSVAIFFGVTMAFNHLRFAHIRAHQETAYFLDALETRILLRIAPDFWRSTYLNGTVRDRFHGIFYPDGETMRITVEGTPVALRMASLLPDPREIEIRLDGQETGTFVVAPSAGARLVPVGNALTGRRSVDVALSFPDQPSPGPGQLWPVTIEGVSSDFDGTMVALHDAMVGHARRIEGGDISRRRRRLLLDEMQALIQTEQATLARLDALVVERSAASPSVAQAAARCPSVEAVKQAVMREYGRPASEVSDQAALVLESEALLRFGRCRVVALQG